MAAFVINLTVSGDTPAGVSLTALTPLPAGVTPPAAFTSAGGGVWQYPFTDASPSAAGYEYTFAVTWADGAVDTGSGAVAGGTTPAGYYASLADLNAFALPADLISYSNDGTETSATLNVAQVQYWLTKADQWVNREWSHGAVPGVPAPVPTSDPDFPALTDAAAQWTVSNLYRRRGMADKGSDADGKMAGLLVEAKSTLRAVITRRQQEAACPVAVVQRTPEETYRTGYGYGRGYGAGACGDGACGPEY